MRSRLVLLQILIACLAGGASGVSYESHESDIEERDCSSVVKPTVYVVEKGDHLSDIIRTFGFKPLYGKKARVVQISELNEIKKPNLIFPGQDIFLPFNCEEDASKYVLIDRQNDRMIDSRHLVKVKTKILANGTRNTMMYFPNGKTLAFDEEQFQQSELRSPTSAAQPQVSPIELKDEKTQAQIQIQSPTPTPPQAQILPPTQAQTSSTLSVYGVYGFSRIDAKENDDGAKATLLSQPMTAVVMGWDLHWTPKLTTGFSLANGSVEMRRASLGEVQGGKQALGGLGLNLQYQWTDKFKSTFGIDYESRLFVASSQTGTALVELYQQPSFVLNFERELIQVGTLGFDVNLGFRHMAKSSIEAITIKDSDEYQFGAQFRQQLEKMQYSLKLNYLNGQQKSNLSIQDNSSIEAQFGIKREIGK
jgi:hypothetical protein